MPSRPGAPQAPRRCTTRRRSVEPVEDDGYLDQNRQGELLALAALEYMASDASGGGWLLSMIAGAQPKEHTGVEIGFWHCIAAYARAGMNSYGEGWYRRWMRKVDTLYEKARKREAEERSARARHGAQARWAKHRGGRETAAG